MCSLHACDSMYTHQLLLRMQAQSAQELQQSSAKQLAELQWELQYAWQQSEQADKAQKAAMQSAQDKIGKLERDCQQTGNHAARVEEKAARVEAEGVKLAQQLTDVKVGAWCLTNKLVRPERNMLTVVLCSCHVYMRHALHNVSLQDQQDQMYLPATSST